ncbi:uncharacterized protein LOC132034353 [Lycium ferocissimum]|uniref:uncharacterized protein LOC132034353 n=1 Tax=Lycium ferocissimum TaxID=112874 RepID=UPI002815B0AF|nr:uncharacterized protein LOC132034353 [Lycium ferocissimum]XP_059280658.1 uncharacterized protein LOC132034353 [Lycium ferocissimum]XP_059280659.1 uncharacterized protein LOC132034353 [Lycium ferocissimum]
MDSFEGNGDYMDGGPADQLLSLESSNMSGYLGEPEIPPRIGNQYQVEIPPLQGNCTSYIKMLADQKNIADISRDFMVGLAIPLMWVNPGVGSMKREKLEDLVEAINAVNDSVPSEPESTGLANMHSEKDNIAVKMEPSDTFLDNKVTLGESANLSSEKELQEIRVLRYCLVPGTVLDIWTGTEKASFVLGLYIFEKNFVHVKRFVETKGTGDILSFYYGKFYRSDVYRRWSECRKVRSRRSVCGQKMFTGSRQQELMSRLLPRISEENQKALAEVSKAFGEGKILLEEYVFSLKAMIGVNMLIEAVGIGKGKYDLTCMASEPSRSNHAVRSELPAGKDCSSLTTNEVIKFLTGDYRLSKARSYDLFWEAVWPRLLARGWQTEQPKNLNYAANPKNALVFLVPGVEKFSRRLEKGNHYFDSVTDVLGKVASDTKLLELDAEGGCIKSDWTDETKLEQDDLPTRQRPCYLQPPNRYTDAMKFTVVDTSLSDGKPYKLRELRSLPVDISNKLSSGNHAEESEEESTDESDSVGTSVLIEAETKHNNSSRIISNGEMHSDEGYKINVPSQKFQEASNEGILASSTVPVNDSKKTKNMCEAKKPRKVVQAHSFKRLKENSVDFVAPVAKRRRRLTACSRASVLVNSLMEKGMGHPSSSNDNIPIASSEDKVSSSNSSKSSPSQSAECASADRHVSKLPDEEPQTREMIDLNEPQVPVDSEFEILMPALTEDRSGNMKSPDDVCGELKTSTHSASMEQQQPSLNSRRHSTRNRPPTTRALEALANGFLTVNSRQKSKEGVSKKKSTSRSSRQTPGGMRVTDFSNSTVVSQMEEDKGAVSMGGDTNMFGKIQHPPEESGMIISGP